MDLRKPADNLEQGSQAADRGVEPVEEAGFDSRVEEAAYDSRVVAEQRQFSESRPADGLPLIYQHWANTFLRPRLVRAGFDGPLAMFRAQLAGAYDASPAKMRRFLSIGSGDCQTEIGLAAHLVQDDRTDFVFECFELNPELVARGAALAAERGLADRISVQQVDANRWTPSHEYDGVLGNSSLHHIENLEGVFEGIASSLMPTGTFVTSDTIGRNGHMRWPEALEIVEEYWRTLPPEYRFNCQLGRQEEEFVNWDCSTEGFEGIRAQDILPLLIRCFDFDFFAAFANIVDPFIDRTFGHNFDPAREWDRDFVARIEARDRAEIRCGRIKPTHIVAAMCVHRPGKNVMMDGLTPQFAVRDPGRAPRVLTMGNGMVDGSAELAPALPTLPFAQDVRELRMDISPANPQGGDYLVARLRLPEGCPTSSCASDHASIELEVEAKATLRTATTAGVVESGLGCFPAGELRVTARVGDLTVSQVVDVEKRATASACMPQIDYSDLWWNAGEPGWGISIHQHANGQLVAFWLGHDANGGPTWLSLHPGGWESSTVFKGVVYEHRTSGAPESDRPAELTATIAGEGSVDFLTWRSAKLTWHARDRTIVKDIERMDF